MNNDQFFTPKADLDNLERTVETREGLPNVLILGDSISIGYTPHVQNQMAGQANVQRPNANCGDTRIGLESIDAWLGDTAWDVIHFNWGLWDFCYRHPDAPFPGNRDKTRGSISIPIENYVANLEKLISRMQETGARLIFATTTRVPEGETGRFVGDDVRYNAAACQVMDRHGIPINDLHTLSTTFGEELCSGPSDVHYTSAGSEKLGQQVTQAIRKVLLATK